MDDILNEVLAYIRLVRDDKQKLKKILDFILEEIYEKPEKVLEIPEKYEKLLHPIAQAIDCGLICYLNLDTLEIEELPSLLITDRADFETQCGEWEEEFKHQHWENHMSFEPLGSRESFRIMEGFAAQQSDAKFQEQLFYALNNRKPFASFKWKVDNSPYRQDWFDFKQQWLEGHIREDLHWFLEQQKEE